MQGIRQQGRGGVGAREQPPSKTQAGLGPEETSKNVTTCTYTIIVIKVSA